MAIGSTTCTGSGDTGGDSNIKSSKLAKRSSSAVVKACSDSSCMVRRLIAATFEAGFDSGFDSGSDCNFGSLG